MSDTDQHDIKHPRSFLRTTEAADMVHGLWLAAGSLEAQKELACIRGLLREIANDIMILHEDKTGEAPWQVADIESTLHDINRRIDANQDWFGEADGRRMLKVMLNAVASNLRREMNIPVSSIVNVNLP